MKRKLQKPNLFRDVPCYGVVLSCEGAPVFLKRPADVPWVEMLANKGWEGNAERAHHCGGTIPPGHGFQFYKDDGSYDCYFVTQCNRCLTIFWRDHVPGAPTSKDQ